MPIISDNGSQMKLLGCFRPDPVVRNRLTMNINNIATSASQNICESHQSSNQAEMVVPAGAAIATAICQAEGGAVPVRRGIIVNRNPTAKHIMKPWICVIE